MSLVSLPSWGLTMDDLVMRAGLYYEKFTVTPYTGEVEGLEQGKFKNGIKDSEWIGYHKNGQLDYKGSFKNGRREGYWEFYYRNGELWMKGNFKDGYYVGNWVGFYEDGRLMESMTGKFKKGFKVSD